MKYSIIAFDLQGTLTDSSFSNAFWMKTLPRLYASEKNLSFNQAKEELKGKFKEFGKYDYRYYSVNYWLKEMNPELKFAKLCKLIKPKPNFYNDSLELIKELSETATLMIISSTTKDFIKTELGKNKKYFKYIFSSIEDFNTAGKPKELYAKIAKTLNISPAKIIYIGNDIEMDIKNAKEAGYDTFFFDAKQPRKEIINKLKELLNI